MAVRGSFPSFPQIIALAAASGLPYRVGDTFRPGDPLYHGDGWAVDFMGYDQDALATYFMGFDTLEVIHRGRKSGQVFGSSANQPYASGSNTQLLREHENHLHVAMTPAQANAALAGKGVNPLLAAAQGVVGTITSPISALASVPDIIRPFFTVGTTIASPNFWRRVGQTVLGSALIVAGISFWLRRPVGRTVNATVDAAGSLVSTAAQGFTFGFGAGKAGGLGAVGGAPRSGPPRPPGTPKPPPAVTPVTAVPVTAPPAIAPRSPIRVGARTTSAPTTRRGIAWEQSTYVVPSRTRGVAKRPPSRMNPLNEPGLGPKHIGGRKGT